MPPSPSPVPTVTKPWWSTRKVIGRLLAVVVGATGMLGAFVLRSDVTINPRTRLKPDDPFSTLFTVTNEGTLPIKDVTFTCFLNDVEVRSYGLAVRGLPGNSDPRYEPIIDARKSQDVTCDFAVMGNRIRPSPGRPFVYGFLDISMAVSYRPLWWWRRMQAERFIGRTDGSGNIVEWSNQVGAAPPDWAIVQPPK